MNKKEKFSEEREPLHIPQVLQKILEQYPEAYHIFNKLPYSHQKEYLEWISSSKKEVTRLKNMEKMISMLLKENQKNLKK